MITRIVRAAFCGTIALLLAGCDHVQQVNSGAAVQSSDDAYYVIGASLEDSEISVEPVSIKDGTLWRVIKWESELQGKETLHRPKDGYIIGKAHGGDTLAIWSIRGPTSIWTWPGPKYVPCGGRETLSFNAIAGKVVYITNIHFTEQRGGLIFKSTVGLNVSYQNDMEGARAFLRKNYPNLVDSLVQGQSKSLPTTEACF